MVFRFGMVVLLAGSIFFAGCNSDDPVSAPAPAPAVREVVIQSSDYLNHRFFHLDLPPTEPHGRLPGDRIVVDSIKIFKLLEPGEPEVGDLLNVAVYVDSLGFRHWDDIDFSAPYIFGGRWREVWNWDPLFDPLGALVAVDLEMRFRDQDVLGVIYEIRDAKGNPSFVGDRPGIDQPQQSIPGVNGLFYRMKLLKAPVSGEEPFTFDYVVRNIYALGGMNIDPYGFDLRIERNEPGGENTWQDETGLDYIRVFGLDRDDLQRTGTPDGLPDIWDPALFDLARGLVQFPSDTPWPFAPGGRILTDGDPADMTAEAFYSGNADTSSFGWNPSFLRHNQAWGIYDPAVYPVDYPAYSAFRIIAEFSGEGPEGP